VCGGAALRVGWMAIEGSAVDDDVPQLKGHHPRRVHAGDHPTWV